MHVSSNQHITQLKQTSCFCQEKVDYLKLTHVNMLSYDIYKLSSNKIAYFIKASYFQSGKNKQTNKQTKTHKHLLWKKVPICTNLYEKNALKIDKYYFIYCDMIYGVCLFLWWPWRISSDKWLNFTNDLIGKCVVS